MGFTMFTNSRLLRILGNSELGGALISRPNYEKKFPFIDNLMFGLRDLPLYTGSKDPTHDTFCMVLVNIIVYNSGFTPRMILFTKKHCAMSGNIWGDYIWWGSWAVLLATTEIPLSIQKYTKGSSYN